MKILKKTRLAFIVYRIPSTTNQGHCILTLKGYFWNVTKTEMLNYVSKQCQELVDKENAVITEIKIIK